ncbi:MAG: metallophosphoesterase [Ramlibacter sp.]|nr:metallophosphoesterase [Ramlibacter sp.]
MAVIVHLSDLHFGRVDERLLTPLVAAVEAARPDVVVVSGDLTQRAHASEFRAARDFLNRLPRPRLVVPGNHDVPLYNIIDRFVRPLAHFRKFIEPDAHPLFIDAELAVIGVNTARSMVIKNGRINEVQIAAIRAAFSALPAEVCRVVVTHHPFDVGLTMMEGDRVGRAALAMRAFAECGVDLLLSGHLHAAYGGEYAPSSPTLEGFGALAVSAGTATSTRVRGDPNEFNVLRISSSRVEVERHAWVKNAMAFERTSVMPFERCDQRWRRV